jgi:hypothetical protein
MTTDIMLELSNARLAIMAEADPETRFETRRNALEVQRKICKSVMLCGEEQIRHELMKDGMLLGEFAESMLELAKGMTKEERERYREEGLFEKLAELQEECDEIDMERLADILVVFEQDEEGGADGEEGNEDDEGLEDAAEISMPPPETQRTKVFSIGELS